MTIKATSNLYFHEYFSDWLELYKRGAVRPVTFQKYLITLQRITELAPTLKINELNKRNYQLLLNNYAQTHERQTTMDFHHHLKSAILDAVDERVLNTDPTRKAIVKGKSPTQKKAKFLSQFQLQSLIKCLCLENKLNWDWFILLIAKTGLRFSEALALTPNDFNFMEQKVSITKTWNYKNPDGGYSDTKNASSKRSIQIDSLLCDQFSKLVENFDEDKLLFINGRVFNSTVNNRLKQLCIKVNIPIISIHSLRHTHASLLIYSGVSVASIAKRLGHSSVTTTQETYLHIIQELENQDNEKIVKHLSLLTPRL